MAEFRKAGDAIMLAPQLAPEDFQRAADAGVKLVINNRVEGEAPDQMPDETARELAEQAGLAYAHIPVQMSALSMADVDAMRGALNGAGGPVLAYCLSGARSAALWALAEAANGGKADVLLEATRECGYDLEGLRPTLESLSAQAG